MKNTLNETDNYTDDNKGFEFRECLSIEANDDCAEDEEAALLTEEFCRVQGWI